MGSKYISAANYNKFTEDFIANSIKSASLINKFDIAGFITSADLDKKKNSNISSRS